MNYVMPTTVLPKVNGKQHWRNDWFSVLGKVVGAIPRATQHLAPAVRAEGGHLKGTANGI